VSKKVKVKKQFVLQAPHRYGNSRAIWDHIVLPVSGRGDIPAFTPAN